VIEPQPLAFTRGNIAESMQSEEVMNLNTACDFHFSKRYISFNNARVYYQFL